MSRHPLVPAELTRGPFTLVEARQAGLTRRHLQGASWRRVGSSLYVWAPLADKPALLLEAVHRRLPVAAVFSGQTAAWLHGLDLPPCDPVEVTISESCGISARAGMVVRRAELAEEDVVERRGMRATSAVRMLADLSHRLPLVEAVVAMDMALHREAVHLGHLHAYLAAHPRRKGVARLRQVIELAEPASESAMETRLRLLLVLAGLPRPEAQVPLHDERGHFLGRPDLYYRAHRLALEYDGSTHRESVLEDNRRQNRLINAGFRLLRFAAADVHRTPDSIVAVVRAALCPPDLKPASGGG
jgi:very-short-patch-repair endonuclease